LKKELHPGVIALVVIVALALVGWYGYQKLKPGDYVPSPRMGGGSAEQAAPAPEAVSASKSPGEQAYEQSMQGGGVVPGAVGGK
jgi:hypothetical protein